MVIGCPLLSFGHLPPRGEELVCGRLGVFWGRGIIQFFSTLMNINIKYNKNVEINFMFEDKKMDATLSLNFLEVKSLVTQFDVNRKIELIEILEKETFPIRFKNLLNKFKTDEIGLDEITREVEIVRGKRYDA